MKHALEIWRDEYRETCVLEGRREGVLEGRREGVLEGRREGVLEGRREGMREKAIEFARWLRAKGMSVEETAEATGLTVDEILQL